MNVKTIVAGSILALGSLWIAACATTDKAVIEQYASATPTSFEGAVAVVLEDKSAAKVNDVGKELVVETFRRVKLMNRKALDCSENASNCRLFGRACYSDVFDKVEMVEARLITPEGKVFVVPRDEMTDRTTTDPMVPSHDGRCLVWRYKGATPGSIIEEKSRIRTSSIVGIGGTWFQGWDPVLEASYSLDTPADYEYKWQVCNTDIKPTNLPGSSASIPRSRLSSTRPRIPRSRNAATSRPGKIWGNAGTG